MHERFGIPLHSITNLFETTCLRAQIKDLSTFERGLQPDLLVDFLRANVRTFPVQLN